MKSQGMYIWIGLINNYLLLIKTRKNVKYKLILDIRDTYFDNLITCMTKPFIRFSIMSVLYVHTHTHMCGYACTELTDYVIILCNLKHI